jgi:hypothetical protein
MSAPNIDEKIAATYLRLNGFLLLPHFTAFISIENKGKYHRHIDLLGFFAPNARFKEITLNGSWPTMPRPRRSRRATD